MFVKILILIVQSGLLFSAVQQRFISYYKIKSATYLFPVMKGLLRNPVLTAEVDDLHNRFLLFENSNHLFFSEFSLFIVFQCV